jgi:tetratricopeptide (TPR) repeat protein
MITAITLHAESPNVVWLLYEQGNAAVSQHEYGKALQLYKSAIEGAGNFPEAEAALGDVYLAEGETTLAQKQYQKAYDLKKAFYIPDMQYAIMYKLANVLELQQQYKQMEDWLLKIVADDKRFQETATQRLRTQLERNFFDKGLDRVLFLYSFEDSFAAEAHSRLGVFYYRTGRYSQSVSQLLYASVYRLSRLEKARKERDAEFEFSNLTELLTSVDSSEDLRAYAIGTGIYRDLYYLAGSTFALGFPRHSANLWKAIAGASAAGRFKDLAIRQLKKPFMEPLLTISR